MKWQAYPEYRESGHFWLGPIPADWEVRRNGRLFTQRQQTGFADLPILEVSINTGVRVRDMESSRKQVMADREAYKRAAAGDIAYNMMRLWQGAVGMVPVDGLVSPAYVVASPKPGVDSRYYSYLYRTAAYLNEIDGFSRGIVKDRNRLYWEQFKQMPSPFPPMADQQAIADFLDRNAIIVNRLIRNKRRLIAVLNEQKQAIITRAVTRGLDPHAKLKPSGVDWLDEVPAHWRIGRVKSEMACFNTRRIPLNGSERGRMTVRSFDYYGASGVIDRVESYIFDDELLLIAEDGANLLLRSLPLAIIARGKFWVNNHAHILKPRRGSIEYFAALLECIEFEPWITGAAQPKLTQDRLMSIRIPVPPVEEQREIASWVQERTGGLQATIDRTIQEVALIREYRTRLIADVVIGKIDVRHFAPEDSEAATAKVEPGNLEIEVESDETEAEEVAVGDD